MTEEKIKEAFDLYLERRTLQEKKANLHSRSLTPEEIIYLTKMYEHQIKEITQKIHDL